MNKVIAIGGEPASGKTTLMRRIIQLGGRREFYQDNPKAIQPPKVWGLDCELIHTSELPPNIKMAPDSTLGFIVLGHYQDDKLFAGTDAFSLAIQPQAVSWMHLYKGYYDVPVVYEGDRIFNESFFNEILSIGIQLQVFILTTPPEILAQRHAFRKDSQSAVWLKGRKTKLDTIQSHNKFLQNRYNITVLQNVTPENIETNARIILKAIGADNET